MNFRQLAKRFAWSLLMISVLAGSTPGWAARFQDEGDSLKVASSPLRTWSSPDGKFKREGKLVEILGDRVRLEMTDGKSTVAQAAKLSKADQEFIAAERKRMEENADSPFMDEEPGASAGGGASAFSSGRETDVQIDYGSVSVVDLDPTNSVTINPEDWGTAPRKSVKRFRIPAYTVHANVTGFACSQGEKMFAVSLSEPFGIDPNGDNGPGARRPGRSRGAGAGIKSWVDIVDLETTKTKARFPLLDEQDAVGDVLDEGNLILTYGGTFSREPQIRILTVTNEGLQLEKSWPARGERDFGARVRLAGFLPDQRVMVDYSDHLLVLKLNPVEPLFKIAKDNVDWEISRDRTKAIVENKQQKFLIDLNKGECLGVVGGAKATSGSPSPDGSRFANFENSTLTLRNSQSEKLDEFFCPVFWPEPQLSWIDDRTLRLQTPNQQFFVDVDRRVVFLEVVNAFAPPTSRGGWVVEKVTDAGSELVQVSQVNPQNNSGPNMAEYQQDLPDEAESLLLLQPGESVRITSQLTADPSQETAARQRMGELLKKRGVTIDPNSANEIRLSSSVRNEKVEYRSIGAPIWSRDAVQTVNVTMVDQKAELIVDGETVWSRASTSGPGFMLQMREGETAQQAADRQSGNGSSFWGSITMPQHIARHPKGGAWNRVMQTPSGYKKVN